MTQENLVLVWDEDPDDVWLELEPSDEPGHPVYFYAQECGEFVEATLTTADAIAIRDWLTARLDSIPAS
jgi:hypothetical protein